MEAVFRHILKSLFDEFVTGLDENVEFSRSRLNLRDLKVKENKVHEIFADFTGAPAEFAKGRIDALQLEMSLSGEIEVVLSNVVLNLTLTPLKALKNALMPEPAKQDGFVHRVPADLRRPEHWNTVLGSSSKGTPTTAAVPRYCPAHSKLHKRETTKVHETQCDRCKVRLQTNFVECKLCAPCSTRESRCLLCGEDVFRDEAPTSTDGFAYAMTDIRNPEYFQKVLDGGPPPYQVPPRYCRHHSRPERRPTTSGQTRMTQCMMCKVRLQTNYEELSLCAPCSQQENGCMLCGAYLPPTDEGSSRNHSSAPAVWMKRKRDSRPLASMTPPGARGGSMTPPGARGAGPRLKTSVKNTVNAAKEEGPEDLEAKLAQSELEQLPVMLRRRSTDSLSRQQIPVPSEIGESDLESEHFLNTPPNELADKDGKAGESKPSGEGPATPVKAGPESQDDEFETPHEEAREEARKFPHGPRGAGASRERPRTHAHWRKGWQHLGIESSDELVVPLPPGGVPDPALAPPPAPPSSVETIPEDSEV